MFIAAVMWQRRTRQSTELREQRSRSELRDATSSSIKDSDSGCILATPWDKKSITDQISVSAYRPLLNTQTEKVVNRQGHFTNDDKRAKECRRCSHSSWHVFSMQFFKIYYHLWLESEYTANSGNIQKHRQTISEHGWFAGLAIIYYDKCTFLIDCFRIVKRT